MTIVARSDLRHPCPSCGKACPGYDTRQRSWRRLDTCQFKTIIEADGPRAECGEHGVLQIDVPWAALDSGFTVRMESLIIDWLLESSISAVARRMHLTWDEIDGVKQRAVKRGLEHREIEVIRRVGVDETSYQKRHECVTVVSDLERSRVVFVADDRKRESLHGFWRRLTPARIQQIEASAMEMCAGYVSSTLAHVEDARTKICFDRFHAALRSNDAVNTVRKQENRELAARVAYARRPLARCFAQGRARVGAQRRGAHDPRAPVGHRQRNRARRSRRRRREPQRQVQWIKKQACGLRNREHFRNAIYFHLGGLHLYPGPDSVTRATF